MVKVNFVREGGETLSTEIPVGYTIMEAAKELDLPEIPADCGGSCACATCHIYVDVLQWPQLKIKDNSLEQELLEYEKGYITDKSRLACQIQLNDELNNVTVKLINDELL
jgi:2Fe-2S ferredoxin